MVHYQSITINTFKYTLFFAIPDEIFVNVDNLRCLLKLNGLPNDLDQTGPIEVSPDVQGI